MVLKQNKRALEDGKSCHPVKCHKRSEYSIDQSVGIGKIVLNKIYGRIHRAQLERFHGDKLLISSREINPSNDISLNVGTYFLEKDGVHEKPVEGVKTSDDGSVMTELVHGQISVCGCKQEQCLDSSVSIPTEEVVEEVLTDGTFQGSNLCEDDYQTPQERVFCRVEVKDIETCISVSSVGNSRSPRVSEDFDLDLVSASSLSSKDMLCDSDTMAQECKGSEKIDCAVPPPFVSDSGDFCSRTCVESDCNEEHFSQCESATGFGGYYRKKVPIGPEFQAEIPICMPQVHMSSSDLPGLMLSRACHSCKDDDDDGHTCRMLGKCVWPLAGSNDGLQDYCVGQGRSTDCGCPDANSIRCVKEHIEVEREKLKLKLGEVFYLWGFDDMGECVSEKWTRQEETFSNIVSMNPMSSNKNFWNYLSVAFPSRRKEELVSYYFNVFVLRRRALQNRIDPDNIDSDDDEEDWHESEIGLSHQHVMIEDDGDSDAESDGSEGDDEVSESDEEMPGATEEEDEVAESFMSEGHMTSRTNHKISYYDPENHVMDCQDKDVDDLIGQFAVPLQHRIIQSNHNDFIEGQDLQNDSCMPYEWNHGIKSSSLMCIRAAGVQSVQEEKFKEAMSSDDSHKEERLADLHYGNEVLCGGGKPYGNLSRKEFVIDAHSSLLDPYDSKLWDIALVTSLKTDADRLVSTCSLIKELFGDETRENDRNRC